MKNIKTIISVFLCVSILFVTTTSIYAINDANEKHYGSNENNSSFESDQTFILGKIEDLGKAKLRFTKYLTENQITEYQAGQDSYLDLLYNNIVSLRNELIDLGAKPSTEVLKALPLESPITVRGVLINDFASFENTFGDVFDLWGIQTNVTKNGATYNTYQILIQDNGSGKLASCPRRRKMAAKIRPMLSVTAG